MATEHRTNLAERRAAAMAAKSEQDLEPLIVELPDGYELTFITNPEGIPVAALEAFEEDRIAGFIKAILGPDQWEHFKKFEPTLEDLRFIAEDWTKAMGWIGGPPESSASGG